MLWRVNNRYQREADRTLVPLGLTQLQFMTLVMAAWLGRAGQSIRQADIAHQGAVHPMQVSLMLKTLEEKGLITQQGSPSDVRANLVFVTEAGWNSLERSLPLLIEVQRSLFGEEGRPEGSFLRALVEIEHRSPGDH